MKSIINIITNVQIVSALIWAMAIMACSYLTTNTTLSSILVVAAGFHVILLAQSANNKACTNTRLSKD